LPVNIGEDAPVFLPSLRTPPSKYSRHVRYTLYEFPILLDSSSISADGWSQIAQCVQLNYALYDGFVILHGTDSLSYTASALSFMFSHLGRPIILTGSQSPIFALQSDAVDNLLGSLIIAGTFLIPEVCLFFHHALYRGNRTTKISASSFEAFASPNFPPLATVTGMGIDVNWNLIRRPTTLAKFAVQFALDTAHVACLRVFPGITPSLLDSVLNVPNLRGLILETFGAGNAPSGPDGALTAVIRAAIARGTVIVNVSQCPSGTVSPLYAPASALGAAGVVFGRDLTTEAALTKLFFLLARPELGYDEIAAQMGESLRGEMTEAPATMQFAHLPADEEGAALSPAQMAFAELGYTIAMGDVAGVRARLDADRHRLLLESDYAGNTALHLAAVGAETEVVRELLVRGASVHVRNFANNTPLWLAEKMGREANVELLRRTGAMLHVEEKSKAEEMAARVVEENRKVQT
jgi:lysophospholipase